MILIQNYYKGSLLIGSYGRGRYPHVHAIASIMIVNLQAGIQKRDLKSKCKYIDVVELILVLSCSIKQDDNNILIARVFIEPARIDDLCFYPKNYYFR